MAGGVRRGQEEGLRKGRWNKPEDNELWALFSAGKWELRQRENFGELKIARK